MKILNTKTRTKLGAALLVSLIGLSACSGNTGGTKEGGEFSGDLSVRVYGDWPFVKKYAEAFMKEHPEAKIDVGGIDNNELRNNGGRLFTSDEAPDVVSFTLYTELVDRWVKAGAVLPLDDVWEKDGLAAVHDKTTAEVATASDGKKYAVPLGLTVLPQLFYNKSAFDKAGVSVPKDRTFASQTDFLQAMDKVKAAGYVPPVAATGALPDLPWSHLLPSSCGTETYLKMSGNWKKDAQNAPKYTDPCSIRALEALKEWSDKLFPEGYSSVTYDQASALFDTQKSAAWLQGSWAPPVAKPGFDWDFALLPPVGESSKVAMPIGLDSFMVPAKAHNPQLAKSFISYMVQKSTLETGMDRVPARTDLDLSKVISSPLEANIAAELKNHELIPAWFSLVPNELIEPMTSAVGNGLLAGKMTAQQAGQALQDAADRYRQSQ
ncbi:ABC transporter substrate-binding protein [Pseudarthrobacter sp. CC12]|uniref:ABC transporter substrate-binding protein n=1 Tax=Pseudarthrobacter sp. CC12 TaxID=3029193 RepID=UPI0032663AE7